MNTDGKIDFQYKNPNPPTSAWPKPFLENWSCTSIFPKAYVRAFQTFGDIFWGYLLSWDQPRKIWNFVQHTHYWNRKQWSLLDRDSTIRAARRCVQYHMSVCGVLDWSQSVATAVVIAVMLNSFFIRILWRCTSDICYANNSNGGRGSVDCRGGSPINNFILFSVKTRLILVSVMLEAFHQGERQCTNM